MFSFDPKSRILKVQKIPESELELNLLEYQRESYNKYVTETVYNDMQYLVQAMRDSIQVSQVEAEFRVEDLYRGSYKREVKKQSPSYYPVYAKFTIDGATFPNWVEVFRIPAMDADGILNVDGERRVLLMQMVAAERVSYAADKQTVSVTTPKRNISLIFDGTKDVMVKYGANAKIPMHKLIRAYNAKERVYDDPSKLFTSAFILSAFATDSGATDEAVEDELDKLKVHATYSGDDYSLGKTRDALNEVLSLDRAHGRILSRKVGPYEAGHRVDEEVLRYVHKNRVNELYVKAVPDIVGYKLTQELTVSFVPAGTRNNDRLIAALPQFAAYTAIPQDSEVLIHMSSKETLTDEDVMFLYDVGAAFVDCKRSGSAPIRATFEEEIIGNYTVRLGDIFGHNIPEGRYHDEWVCFYNNPNLDRTDMDHLNTHDLMALYSLCGFIRKNPNENFLLDKDFGLLKKVLAANEIFSNAMREVVPEFIRKYRAAISRGIGKNMLSESNFFGLTNMWKSYLWERNYLDIADTINPIAVVAQTNHLVSTLHTSEIPEKVRLLSMGFYGRICPYETPSGQKLGVTNTKAIGAKIRDGILTTPYRRVLKNSRGEIESISTEVTYMDAQEEAQYRIGDILSLKKEGYRYLNTKVLARVPAPNNQVTSPYVITGDDCGTTDGIEIKKSDIARFITEADEVESVFRKIITGRYMAGSNVYIDKEMAKELSKKSSVVKIRSVITCKDPCCKKCYGDDPSTHRPAAIGLPIGFIAAQSIGEPGTQLSMDSFKKGGIASKSGVTSAFEKLEAYIECKDLSKNKNFGSYDPVAWESGEVHETYSPDGTKKVTIGDSKFSKRFPADAPLRKVAKKGEGLGIERGDYDMKELLMYTDVPTAQLYFIHTLYNIYKNEGEINMKHFEVLAAAMTVHMVVSTDRDDLYVGQYHDSIQMCKGSLANTVSVPTMKGVMLRLPGPLWTRTSGWSSWKASLKIGVKRVLRARAPFTSSLYAGTSSSAFTGVTTIAHKRGSRLSSRMGQLLMCISSYVLRCLRRLSRDTSFSLTTRFVAKDLRMLATSSWIPG